MGRLATTRRRRALNLQQIRYKNKIFTYPKTEEKKFFQFISLFISNSFEKEEKKVFCILFVYEYKLVNHI